MEFRLSSFFCSEPDAIDSKMSSEMTLYFASGSPPARATLLLARYLQLDIDLKHVDLGAGEQHSDEFLKLNPLHKVPVLVDGDFALYESRAILGYLVNSKKPESDLYPSEPKAKAIIDQRLYFDATVLIARLADLVVSLFPVLATFLNYLE